MRVAYDGPEGSVIGEATEMKHGYVSVLLIESTTRVSAGAKIEVRGTLEDLLAMEGWKEVADGD